MRRFRRPALEVPTLARTGSGGEARQNHIDQYIRDGTVPSTISDYHWRKPDVQGLLLAMQGSNCAYCGMAPAKLVVDHFRPTGKATGRAGDPHYWWLAHEPSNYFLSCDHCNRDRKGAQFPLEPGAVRITWETRSDVGNERRVLFDPVEDKVEELLEPEGDTPFCRLVPNRGLGGAVRARVEDVIEFFGLSSNSQVCRCRSQVYRKALIALKDSNWNDLRRLAMPHNEHSLVAWSLLRNFAPEELPKPEDERRELAAALWEDLAEGIRDSLRLKKRGKTPRQQDANRLKSICWALWILSRNPPSGSADSVAGFMADLLAREDSETQTAILKAFKSLNAPAGQAEGIETEADS